jgi:hypothetical protein
MKEVPSLEKSATREQHERGSTSTMNPCARKKNERKRNTAHAQWYRLKSLKAQILLLNCLPPEICTPIGSWYTVEGKSMMVNMINRTKS